MEVREIRTALNRLGRTQSELAAHLGVDKGTVSELLSGKLRMRLDTFRKIETFLAEAERETARSGVAEAGAEFVRRGPIFITLEEAIAIRDGPKREKLPPEEYARLRRELRELGEALKRAPVLTDMTDDELLGYDEMP